MGFDRCFEILVENGTEAAFDVAPQRLPDVGLLARYCELHGSNYPFRAGLSCPTKDVGMRRRPVKQCTRRPPPAVEVGRCTVASHCELFFPAALHRRRNTHRFTVLGDSPA